jgi:hypothetical protein
MSTEKFFKNRFKKKLYLDTNQINIDSDDEYINLSPSTTNIIFEHKNTEYVPINIIWITDNINNDKLNINYLRNIVKPHDIINTFDNFDLIKNFFISNEIDLIIINSNFLIKKNLLNYFDKFNINSNQCIILSENYDNSYLKYINIKISDFQLKIKKITDKILRIPKVHLRSLKKKGSWTSKTYIHKFKSNINKNAIKI